MGKEFSWCSRPPSSWRTSWNDNQSAIKLETNGRLSAGPKSRHIDIRYFWIKDRVKAEGISIRHCPTLRMVADFFTKPLQGALFRKFRDVILGYKHMDALAMDLPSPLEERVGETKRSGHSTVHDTSKQNSTRTTIPAVATSVSWADIVKGAGTTSAGTTESNKRTNGCTPKNRMFRGIILSKQSSV
jgi:hypothetical protein